MEKRFKKHVIMPWLYITYIIIFFVACSLFFKWLQVTLRYHLFYAWITFFTTSWSSSANNKFSLFCLSGNIFMSPSFLKDSSAGYEMLGWQFLLSALGLYHHSLLASIVSDNNSTVNLIKIIFYIMSHFSLAAIRIFSLIWFEYFDYGCLCVDFFMFILLGVLWVP